MGSRIVTMNPNNKLPPPPPKKKKMLTPFLSCFELDYCYIFFLQKLWNFLILDILFELAYITVYGMFINIFLYVLTLTNCKRCYFLRD